MTEEHSYIGGTDVVLPDVDDALTRAVEGLDALLAAIQSNVEGGVPFPVACRLVNVWPVVVEARELSKLIFARLYSSPQTSDDFDESTPW